MRRILPVIALAGLALSGCAMDSAGLRAGPTAEFSSAAPVYRPTQEGQAYGPAMARPGYDLWAGASPRTGYNSTTIYKNQPRMMIESAVYISSDGRGHDATGYLRRQCEGENNCGVTASNVNFGDPDPGRPKELVVTYRCTNGVTRIIQIPEEKARTIDCGH